MNLDFSIIIPYYHKKYEINLVLKAFTLQTYPKDRFEILIVDDGSDDNVEEVIAKYSDTLNISYYRLPHEANRSRNRNFGATKAKADLCVFLDSDVIPAKTLLYHFKQATDKDKKLVSLGMRKDLLEFDRSLLTEETLERNFELLDNMPSENDIRTIAINNEARFKHKWKGQWQLLYSHCFCIRKEMMERTSGFDINFIYWGAEDLEFGYRLYKAGYNIEINYDTMSYHIYHPVNFINNIRSLRKNYDIFMKKHKHWSIELIARENECWAVQAIRYQDGILQRKHLVTSLQNAQTVARTLPAGTLLAGIDVAELIESDHTELAYNPEGRHSGANVCNMMGIASEYEQGHFELAIVSEEYKNINYAMFVMILQQIARISKRVITVAQDGNLPVERLEANEKKSIGKHKFVTFTLENDINHNLTRYWFLNLAVATHKLGITTAVELDYDPHREININDGYLYFSDNAYSEIVTRITNQENNFIGDFMPCVMENTPAGFSNRSIDQRIFWEEIEFLNQEQFYIKHKAFAYDKFFLRRNWESELFPGNLDKHILTVGVDKKKILDIKSNHLEKRDNFTFLWSDQFSSPYTNLDLILAAFEREFSGNRKVQLKVLVPNNSRRHYPNENFNKTLDKMIRNSQLHFKLTHNHYMDSLRMKYAECDNIHFIDGVFSTEEISRALYDADCLIDADSSKRIHPLALEVPAFGKQLVTLGDNRYAGYIPDDLYYRIDYELESALFSFGKTEGPVLNEVEFERYYLMHKPQVESLQRALGEAVKRGDSGSADSDWIKKYLEKFDWMTIAENFRSILF